MARPMPLSATAIGRITGSAYGALKRSSTCAAPASTTVPMLYT